MLFYIQLLYFSIQKCFQYLLFLLKLCFKQTKKYYLFLKLIKKQLKNKSWHEKLRNLLLNKYK